MTNLQRPLRRNPTAPQVNVSDHIADTTTRNSKAVLSRVPSKYNGLINFIGGVGVGVVFVLLMAFVG